MKIEAKEGLDALKQLIIENWDELYNCSDLENGELVEFMNNFGELEGVFDNLKNLNSLLENEAKYIK